MILIIDDRQLRQNNYLGDLINILPASIKIFSDIETRDFKDALKGEKELISISDADMVCVHSTSLFETGNPNAKRHFEQFCKKNNISIIYFSGGNSLVSTIKPKAIYTSNVKDFYSRIKEVCDEKIDFTDPDQVLFGDKYLLNQLLALRRKLCVFKSLGILDQIIDEASSNNHPVIRRVFSEWEKISGEENEDAWEKIINQQIETISG